MLSPLSVKLGVCVSMWHAIEHHRQGRQGRHCDTLWSTIDTTEHHRQGRQGRGKAQAEHPTQGSTSNTSRQQQRCVCVLYRQGRFRAESEGQSKIILVVSY